MNVALWIVQGLLALVFAGAGAMKVFAYEKYKAMSEKKGPTSLSRGLVAFIGVAELVGAIGIVLPMATNLAPSLTGWAAVGLATVLLLAIVFHMRRRESPVAPVILVALPVFVALGRLFHWA